MAKYPTEIFGAKKYEKRFGSGKSQYIIYCYDIFGGTFYVRVEKFLVVARFDYGAFHSSANRSLDEFEGFEKIASMLIKLVLDEAIKVVTLCKSRNPADPQYVDEWFKFKEMF